MAKARSLVPYDNYDENSTDRHGYDWYAEVPESALERLDKGQSLFVAGDDHAAVDALTRALVLNPNVDQQKHAYQCRSLAYERLGKQAEADADIKAAKAASIWGPIRAIRE